MWLQCVVLGQTISTLWTRQMSVALTPTILRLSKLVGGIYPSREVSTWALSTLWHPLKELIKDGFKGKANHLAFAFANALLHPQCRCVCMEVAHSLVRTIELDEIVYRNRWTPCIWSRYAWSLLSYRTRNIIAAFQKRRVNSSPS